MYQLYFAIIPKFNLVLTTNTGEVFWQSFLEPLDTLLPAMKLTKTSSLVSWVGVNDPSPGIYSFSLKPPVYYEFHLVYKNSISYWSNGNHTISLDSASVLRVEAVGQVSQYTWSNNAWKKLWSMPRWVLGADCGSFAVATENIVKPCDCLNGYEPIDSVAWGFGDYSKGCFCRDACDGTNDVFLDKGIVKFEGGNYLTYKGESKRGCKEKCLDFCNCVGFLYNDKGSTCLVFYGNLSNFKNTPSPRVTIDGFYLRQWVS